MKTLRRIALLLVIIGAINWGLIGLFRFDLVAAIFGGQTSGLSRIIYTLVGISGLFAIGTLFTEDVDVERSRSDSRVTTTPAFSTEFAEEPDLEQLYNPSRDAYAKDEKNEN